jgi:hypothetical protein
MELLSTDALADSIRRAAAMGLPVAMHAIGDAAVRSALDALEQTQADWHELATAHSRPPRIEHAQLVHPDDLARFGALGVVASMQPVLQIALRSGRARSPACRGWPPSRGLSGVLPAAPRSLCGPRQPGRTPSGVPVLSFSAHAGARSSQPRQAVP